MKLALAIWKGVGAARQRQLRLRHLMMTVIVVLARVLVGSVSGQMRLSDRATCPRSLHLMIHLMIRWMG